MIRRNTKANTFFICGIIFASVGSIFLIVSLPLLSGMRHISTYNQDGIVVLPLSFILVGSVLSLTGIFLLKSHFRKARIRKRLIERGDYITAEITGIPVDYSISVNRRPTFRIECRYMEPVTGIQYFFLSENILLDPVYQISQPTIRVYVDKSSGYSNYYVDIDSIFTDI